MTHFAAFFSTEDYEQIIAKIPNGVSYSSFGKIAIFNFLDKLAELNGRLYFTNNPTQDKSCKISIIYNNKELAFIKSKLPRIKLSIFAEIAVIEYCELPNHKRYFKK